MEISAMLENIRKKIPIGEILAGLPKNTLSNSALASVLFFIVWLLAYEEIIVGILCSIAVFCASCCILIYYPKMKRREYAGMIEKELPFALMAISVELNINVPFEKAIENASRQDYGLLSAELKKVISDVREAGASMQEALFSFSERAGSPAVRRCISQLASIYEQGNSGEAGEPLKRLALEQLARQKAASKEFSGKLVVFSIMFIAISAIIPALFQAFMVVGSMFMQLDFTPLQVLLIAAIGFPALDLAMLLYIRSKTPIFMR